MKWNELVDEISDRTKMAEEKENEEVENLFRKGEKEGPKMLKELEPYFQLVLEEAEDSETGRFKGAVQTLEEKVDELSKRVSVLEEIGEERGSSSSEDGYEREWRWERGSWWFRAPLGEKCSSERKILEEDYRVG